VKFKPGDILAYDDPRRKMYRLVITREEYKKLGGSVEGLGEQYFFMIELDKNFKRLNGLQKNCRTNEYTLIKRKETFLKRRKLP